MSRRLKCEFCNSEFDEDWVETDYFGDKRCPVCTSGGYILDTTTLEFVFGMADKDNDDEDD